MALKLGDIIKIANEFNFDVNETSIRTHISIDTNDQPITSYKLFHNNNILIIKKYMTSEFDKNKMEESVIVTFMNEDICRIMEFECIDDVYNFTKE